ncbi:MAG TPA: hypothetical protein P5567_12955 [Kiritimatiellia bacterium]|nr:hypothetical protein [Kiritimatiellia bacterium]HRZ13351.1 hypothetical protein [Kiritimatiellia bacterium]HSA19009.1 hypothetical protein [Kiritimatiellia bacterium]
MQGKKVVRLPRVERGTFSSGGPENEKIAFFAVFHFPEMKGAFQPCKQRTKNTIAGQNKARLRTVRNRGQVTHYCPHKKRR